MRGLGRLGAELSACARIQLLPYHNLGEGKRQQLGGEAFCAVTPDEARMEQLRELVRETSGDLPVC
jgi:pyruvate formate lyase activating enzyme